MATIITTVAELQAIANNMAGDYELGADIDLHGVSWIPLGASADQKKSPTEFTGTFDGKGHKISNLTINSNTRNDNNMIGLFAELGDCTISNLVIDNADITDEGYNPHVGILAGRAYYTKPTITNVSVQGVIFVTQIDASSTGNPSVAGLLGCLYGSREVSVTDCISTVEIHVHGCNRTLYVAGFIGYGRELLMTRCFAFGDITVENTGDSGINISTMQSLCYYTEHVDCATAVSIYGATANTVQTCGKYLTSSQEFTTTSRRMWDGVTVPYETYVDNKITLLSQDGFIALTSGNSGAYNTEDVDFTNGKYIKLAIDHETATEISYDLTIGGQTFNGVKKVIYNGTALKKLTLNGTDYTF